MKRRGFIGGLMALMIPWKLEAASRPNGLLCYDCRIARDLPNIPRIAQKHAKQSFASGKPTHDNIFHFADEYGLKNWNWQVRIDLQGMKQLLIEAQMDCGHTEFIIFDTDFFRVDKECFRWLLRITYPTGDENARSLALIQLGSDYRNLKDRMLI